MSSTSKAGIHITPRSPHLDFRDLRPCWFNGDCAVSAAWNALGMVAAAGEGTFITAGRSLLAHVNDPTIADDTRRFIQQETQHARLHTQFSTKLQEQGVPIAISRDYLADLIVDLTERVGDKGLMAAALAGEQFIGEFGHALLNDLDLFAGADEAGRSLWIWHAYEEVEHQAALHDAWTHVYGQDGAAHRARIEGIAYMLVFIALAWPAITWAMMPPGSHSIPQWRRTIGHFFGKEKVLRKAVPNLFALTRRSFHPHDNHDPRPALEAAREAAVRSEWEVPPAPITGRSGEDKRHGLLTWFGFVGATLVRTRRYRDELRRSR